MAVPSTPNPGARVLCDAGTLAKLATELEAMAVVLDAARDTLRRVVAASGDAPPTPPGS